MSPQAGLGSPSGAPAIAEQAPAEEQRLVAALRAGDEAAFLELVQRYQALMLRVARTHLRSRALAEEVVQDTWLAVLEGLGRFEGRSSLRTWVFRILRNIASRRGQQEGRSVPFSGLDGGDDEERPSVHPDRFLGPESRWAGHWASIPLAWDHLPEQRLEGRETHELVRRSIAALPPGQRAVIELRDVEGWGAAEVCSLLQISEANQRVLLHRARSKVRQALEDHLQPAG